MASRRVLVSCVVRLIAVAIAVGAALRAGADPTVAANTCRADNSEFRRDATTGWSWATVWYCHNRIGAYLYEDASFQIKTAQMRTEPSWFVCYRHGAAHAGGSDLWYYTLGDVSLPPFQRRQPWGYMPAADVLVKIHPWPGMPECPKPPFPATIRRKPE